MDDSKSFDEQEFPFEPPKKDWPRARGKETIIVAEDSESLRDLMLAMLSGLGYEVLTAAGGHEALRMIEKRHGVDLVITDAIMPRGGGFQIIDEVRQRWSQTPVLITSGFTEEIEAGLKERVARGRGVDPDPEDRATEEAADREATAEARETLEATEIDEPEPSVPLIEFLPKPFTPEQLARLVRDILDRAKTGAPPRKNS